MYEQFQKLECTVIKAQERESCYEVLVKQDNIVGTLVCVDTLEPGETIIGLFGAYENGKYLFVADGQAILDRRATRPKSEGGSQPD